MTTGDRHILLVDDNPRTIEFIEARLRVAGFRTSVASSGEAALEVVRKDPPDLMVLDITMPDMNGYQTCREIKKLNDKIFVLMLTAKTDSADRFWAFQSGADDFFNKPVDPAVLLGRINKYYAERDSTGN
jgi:DNA-binding response OmpR family regulator